jgi:hypothetical protein
VAQNRVRDRGQRDVPAAAAAEEEEEEKDERAMSEIIGHFIFQLKSSRPVEEPRLCGTASHSVSVSDGLNGTSPPLLPSFSLAPRPGPAALSSLEERLAHKLLPCQMQAVCERRGRRPVFGPEFGRHVTQDHFLALPLREQTAAPTVLPRVHSVHPEKGRGRPRGVRSTWRVVGGMCSG